jgi:cellulose synthase operon protein C
MEPITATAKRPFIFAALAVFAISCSSDPKVLTERHVERADRYLAENRFGDAIIEYRQALAYSPKAGDIHLKLARLYVKMDDLHDAYPEFLRAADAMPDDDNAQLQAGNLLLMAGRYQDAKNRARVALKNNPKNVAALVLLGNSKAPSR